LQIEADEGDDFGNATRVLDEGGDGIVFHGPQAQGARVVALVDQEFASARAWSVRPQMPPISRWAGRGRRRARRSSAIRGENRFEKVMRRIADLELGGMDADGEAARARVDIIAHQGPLVALIELPMLVEGERYGGDDASGGNPLAYEGRQFPYFHHFLQWKAERA